MKNKIKYLFASLFIFLYNTLVWAQMEGEDEDIEFPPDADRDGETAGGPAKVSIDMYEGTLLVIAVLLIVGYYLYKRNKRIA